MTEDMTQAALTNWAAKKNLFLKLKDVQELLGVSRTTLWRWHAEHGLKVVRVRDVVRVRESDLQQFLKRHESMRVPDAGAQGSESANLSP
jgi:excisionase family DNA binding protein